MNFSFVRQSSNAKTGPIPITYSSRETCPSACPLKKNGCYSDGGPSAIHWNRLSAGKTGVSFDSIISSVKGLPADTLWRHNVAGDLPGVDNSIDGPALRALVSANHGKRGFTYTHKPLTPDNLQAIRSAVAGGFTINLSANNLRHADELAKTGLPVCAIVAGDVPRRTPEGRFVTQCPATLRDDITCETCALCQKADRRFIVAFPVHGASSRKAKEVSETFNA